ncbi:3-oxoacyl-[acyl-carrier-protein] reductase [Magnetococcales bacterium HHB-1]
MLFKDRVVLVTGSTSGIGRVTARHFAAAGAKVIVTSNETDKLPEALEEMQALSPESVSFDADVTDSAALDELVKFSIAQFGKIDILVNNAGITRDGLFLRMKDDDWDLVLSINLTSIFRLSRRVVRHMMKARYGRIINIASVSGFIGNGGQANYVAAKSGLVGLSKTIAREVAPRGITVNCVAPGFIKTAMTDKLSDKAREAILAQIPMKEMGTSEDVAETIAFLASEQAKYITGETIHVNGGMYMG